MVEGAHISFGEWGVLIYKPLVMDLFPLTFVSWPLLTELVL